MGGGGGVEVGVCSVDVQGGGDEIPGVGWEKTWGAGGEFLRRGLGGGEVNDGCVYLMLRRSFKSGVGWCQSRVAGGKF